MSRHEYEQGSERQEAKYTCLIDFVRKILFTGTRFQFDASFLGSSRAEICVVSMFTWDALHHKASP